MRFVCVWLHVAMYLMCGPRQLFFQCGPETPKGWTPLEGVSISYHCLTVGSNDKENHVAGHYHSISLFLFPKTIISNSLLSSPFFYSHPSYLAGEVCVHKLWSPLTWICYHSSIRTHTFACPHPSVTTQVTPMEILAALCLTCPAPTYTCGLPLLCGFPLLSWAFPSA